MRKLATAFAGVFAVRAIAGFTKQLYDVGLSLENTEQKSTAVFGKSRKEIQKWAAQNAHSFGLTKNELEGASARFGDLLKPMGFTERQTAKMTKETVGLSGALAEWSDGKYDAAEVSAILSKAMLGEREQLKELGISISEADVQARLAKKGQDELTGAALDQAKAIATQELITEKSTDAQKAYAEGAGNMERKQAEATARIKEMRDSLARRLIPAFAKATEFVADLTDKNSDLRKQLDSKLRPVFETLGDVAKKVWAGIVEAWEWAKYIWKGFGPPLIRGVKDIIDQFKKAGSRITRVLDNLEGSMDGKGFREWVDQARRIWRDAIPKLVEAFGQVLHWVTNVAVWLIRHQGVVKAVVAFLVARWTFLKAKVVWSWLMQTKAAIASKVKQIWAMGKIVVKYAWMAGKALVHAARVAASWIIAMGPIGWAIAAVVGLTIIIVKNWDKIKAFTLKIWRAVADWVSRKWRELKDAVVKNAKALWSGVTKWFRSTWDSVKKRVQEMKDGVAKRFNDIKNSAIDKFKAMWSALKNKVNDIRSGIVDRFRAMKDKIVDFFEGIKEGAKSKFDSMRAALARPINWIITNVVNKLIRGWNKLNNLWDGKDIGELAGISVPSSSANNTLRRRPGAFAKGGRVPGHGNRDDYPAYLTPGEFILRKDAVRRIGVSTLEKLNQYGMVPPTGGDPPGFARGGLVAAQQFAKAQHGKPYIWGAHGPRGYDCSGFMSAILNVLEGKAPYSRRFATGNISASLPGLKSGLATNKKASFSIGSYRGNPGHMAGTLGGVPVEAGGSPSRTKWNHGIASGADHPRFIQKFHAEKGGVDIFGWIKKHLARAIERIVGNIGGSGIMGEMARGLARRVTDGLKSKAQTFDNGGPLRPGYTLAYNGTGRDEYVTQSRSGNGGSGVTQNFYIANPVDPLATARSIKWNEKTRGI